MKQVQKISLPELLEEKSSALSDITKSLGVPRDILASDEEIMKVWRDLPEELSLIPKEYLNPTLARMCVAVRTGLFDSALNYIWNTTVINLREKLKKFGLGIASGILNKNIDESKLNDILDSELLNYCLELNLISEDGYFFLNQCRDMRNNYSTAHPVRSGEMIGSHKLLDFLHDCIKYSFNDNKNLVGIDAKLFIDTIKNIPLDHVAIQSWKEQIIQTNLQQKQLLLKALYGIYCDKDTNEEARNNALALLDKCKDILTNDILANILCQYQEYDLSAKTEKVKASNILFEKLGMIGALPESKQCLIFSKAIDNLKNAHDGWDNFHAEPTFAERLLELSSKTGIPNAIKRKFVETIVLCAIGNPYGVSNSASFCYYEMIKNFSPLERLYLFDELSNSKTYISRMINSYPSCNNHIKLVIKTIKRDDISVEHQLTYDKILKG